MRNEIKYILEVLEVKNPSAASYRTKLLEVINDPPALITFADKLKQESQSTKDIPDDRVPFYEFYLAIAWWENNVEAAKDALSNTVHDFRIRDLALNEALGEWLFSVFHFEDQKYDRADRACETAIDILQQLIVRCEEESKYEKARELKKHLAQLMRFQETIQKRTPSPENSDISDKLSVPRDRISITSKLQYFHEELNELYEQLREKNARIPYTLVASRFYIYKLLAPSHSAYRTIPSPETSKEKEIYDDLIIKIGFFEVIEQLVELEQTLDPTASRETLLEKINFTWDNEVNP
jgi:hypothetical protein